MKIIKAALLGWICALIIVPTLSAQALYVPSGSVGTSSNSGVGINTSSPAALLHIQTAGTDGERIETTSTSGYSYLILKADDDGLVQFGKFSSAMTGTTFGVSNANAAYLYTATYASTLPSSLLIGTYGSVPLVLGTNGSERLRIDGSGNVGLGTTNPGDKLNVVAGTNKEIATYVPTAASGISDFDAGGIGWKFSRPNDGAFAHAIYSYNTTGTTKNNLVVSSRDDIVFTAGNSGPGASIERMRITGSGNIGIGTTAPSERLDIGSGNFKSTGSALVTGGYYNNNASVGWNHGDGSYFSIRTNTTDEQVVVRSSGNVGIGTTNPTYKLSVNGTVRAKEVIVDTGWSDYVFEPGYRLTPLSEVEQHIKAEKHLPGIPSATEVAEHGVSMGEMQSKLLAKIEELTLHQIAQEKRLDAQSARIAQLEHENLSLRQP